MECPDWEQAALEEVGSLDPEEHQPQPYAEPDCAHVAQSACRGRSESPGTCVLLGDTGSHPADAEHVVDAFALDCWHAAEGDVGEALPDEQYSKWTHQESTQREKVKTAESASDQIRADHTTLRSSALPDGMVSASG